MPCYHDSHLCTWHFKMIQRSSKRSMHRLIVAFKASAVASKEMLDQSCRAVLELIPKGALVRPPGRTGRAVFSVDPNADLHRIVQEISGRDDVEYAEPDVTDTEQG